MILLDNVYYMDSNGGSLISIVNYYFLVNDNGSCNLIYIHAISMTSVNQITKTGLSVKYLRIHPSHAVYILINAVSSHLTINLSF